jgi:hypothetical protein
LDLVGKRRKAGCAQVPAECVGAIASHDEFHGAVEGIRIEITLKTADLGLIEEPCQLGQREGVA